MESFDSMIKFDIGGKKFHTTKETLMRFNDTVFTSILKGNWKPNHDGYYFFDRSPKNFKIILDYMRKGTLMVEDLNAERLRDLIDDLDFFQVPYNKSDTSISDSFVTLEYKNQLEKWLDNKKLGSILYQGSVDGFLASDFHEKCDNKGATLTVIQSDKELIFGGYSGISWDSSNRRHEICKSSFLFSLKNPQNIPKKSSCEITTICCSDRGPSFFHNGGGGLLINDNSNKVPNILNLKILIPAFNMDKRFLVKDIIVYQVI